MKKMQNIRQKTCFAVIMAFLIGIILPILSFGSETSYVTKKSVSDIPINKVWDIKLSKEIPSNFVNSMYFKVYDEFGNKVQTTTSFDKKDRRIIKIKPTFNYTQGKTYKLVVEPNIKALDGTELTTGITMYFSIKNFYAGLPYENGLVIVGNTAYSIDYLAKNSSKKNEIINGDYKVFFVFQNTKEKIRDVLGNKYIDGTVKPAGYDIRKPMIYIDGEGRKAFYKWDKETGEFKKVLPHANIIMTSSATNLNAKVIGLEVESVEGVYDAKYYEIEATNKAKIIGKEKVAFTTDKNEIRFKILSSSRTLLAQGIIYTLTDGKKKVYLKYKYAIGEGNTAGNINNNGYVAMDDDGYLYYNNTADKNQLYKHDTNGIFHNAIGTSDAQYINMSDEWIYFSNYSDKGKLYRVKRDGSVKEKLNDEYSAYITIVGDDIYYCNHSDGGRLYRMKKDGSDVKEDKNHLKHGHPISENEKDQAAYINVIGDWIYYTNVSDNYRLYVVNKDGTYKARLSDVGTRSIQLDGEWIYYAASNGKLSKIKKDGSKEIVPINGTAQKFDKGFYYNVLGDWVYYSNAEDKGKLYKAKTDGTGNPIKLTDISVSYVNIAYDTLYFVSNKKLYKLPIYSEGELKAEPIVKAKNDIRVRQIDNVDKTVSFEHVNQPLEWIEKQYLPAKIPGILDDNTMHQFVVEWDKKNVRIVNGIRIYKGNLIGYNYTVELKLTIPSEMLNETNYIDIYNNPGRSSGVIEVYNEYSSDGTKIPPKMIVGNDVKIYTDSALTKKIGNAKVVRDGKYNRAVLKNLNLDKSGSQEYYITVTRKDKSESLPTKIILGDIPTIVNTVHKPVIDKDDIGLGVDGRDFTIQDMIRTTNKTLTESKIYLTYGGRRLDLSSPDVMSYDSRNIASKEWTGLQEDNHDSYSVKMKGGRYSIFLVSTYEEFGNVDNRGMKPRIKGMMCSEVVGVTPIEEKLPRDPTLKNETKKRGEVITLSSAPQKEEVAYLIPNMDYLKAREKRLQSIISTETDAALKLSFQQELQQIQAMKPKVEAAITWLSEKGPWPFADGCDEISNGAIRKLQGGSGNREIAVPLGSDYNYTEPYRSNRDHSPNVEYKLVTINKVGVSGVSRGILTIDNKPPIINKKILDETEIVCGTPIEVQSMYENAYIYIVDIRDNLNTAEDLENAYKSGSAGKFKVVSGVTTPLPTSGFKPTIKEGSANYKIFAVDDAGNVTLIPISLKIYVDIKDLQLLLEDIGASIGDGVIINNDMNRLMDIKDEAQKLIDRVNSFNKNEIVSQTDIDNMIYKVKRVMNEVGAPYRQLENDPDNEYLSKAVVNSRNRLKDLRDRQNIGQIVDKNYIVNDIWLPDRVGYHDMFKIDWQAEIGGAPSDIIMPNGDVKRPDGLNPSDKLVTLKGTIKKLDGTPVPNGVMIYTVTVRAKKFDALVSNPADNKVFIQLQGISVSDPSQIDVKFIDDDNQAKSQVTLSNGKLIVGYEITNYDADTWIVTLKTTQNPDGAVSDGNYERNIQIKIGTVTMNQQVKLQLQQNSSQAIVVRQ